MQNHYNLLTQPGKASVINKLKKWAKKIKADLRALQIALTENMVTWYVKALIILTLGYAFSPIDLIPDFIPVLGLLDDLIILPALIYLIIRLMPENTLAYCRQKAEQQAFTKRQSWIAAGIIILVWLLLALWFYSTYLNKYP